MRKLSLSILAASIALTPSGAFAQAAPPPGASFEGGYVGAPAYGPQMMAPQMVQMAPQMMAQQMAPQMVQMAVPQGVPHRLERGGMINPYWMGPQFSINNWQAYGFADPGPGRHWIRYYDDAYLVDGTGRVVDTRGGLDWDQYGEQWDLVNGIPAYRGAREWRPGERDYAWQANAQGYQYGYPMAAPMAMPMSMPAYGYGQYYGGYGYGGGVVIYQIGGAASSAAATTTEEIVEEYVEQAQTRHRRPVRHCQCRRPAPPRRPPPGERG